MSDSPRAFRCTACDANYPATSDYQRCPIHGTETWLARGEVPMGSQEAKEFVKAERARRELREKFEAYYRKREEDRAPQVVAELLASLD